MSTRLVPQTAKAQGQEILVPAPPIYDLANLGEDIVLVFPTTADQGVSVTETNHNSQMLVVEQTNYGAVTIERTGTPGVTSAIGPNIFDWMLDMACFLWKLSPVLLGRLVVGAGNTVDVTCRLQIQRVAGNDVKTLYDRTLTRSGATADESEAFYFPQIAVSEPLPKNCFIRFIRTITATRTAGASNTQIFFVVNKADELKSNVVVHLHAALAHAEEVFGVVRVM